MKAFDVILFVHIAVLLLAMALTGLMLGSVWLAARAATVAELRMTARPQRLGPLYALAILALLGTGFSLLNMSKAPDKFDFGDPFVWTSAVVLLFLFLNGSLILGRHESALRKALAVTPIGPVTPELRAMTIDPSLWFIEYINTFTVFGVVLNMATKPSLVWCVVHILAGAAIGAVIAWFGLTRAKTAVLSAV